MRRALPLLLIVGLVFAALLAERARDAWWAKYAEYTSTMLRPLTPAPPFASRTQRLVLIWVRGLRLDASQRMPTLNALRARGASVIVEHTAPTWRAPATLTLLSGARHETHGVLLPNEPADPNVDTLFQALQRAGRTIALVGDAHWADTFEASVPRLEVVDAPDAAARDDQAVVLALEALRDRAQPVAFVLVELSLPEVALRTNPATYATAVAATDMRVQQLVGALDLTKVAVAVLSDRGLDARGRDGGAEAEVARVPLVLAGAGVREGIAAIARAEDVAPTLAVLMGAAPPVHAQGRPLLEVLAADHAAMLTAAQQLTAFYEAWSEHFSRPRFAAPLLRASEPAMAQGNPATFQIWFAQLDQAARSEREALRRATQWVRLPFAAGIALVVLALIGASVQLAGAASLVGGAMFVAVNLAFVFLGELQPSFTQFPQAQPQRFWAQLAPASALGVFAVGVLSLLLARRRALSEALAVFSSALMVGIAVPVIGALWVYLMWGEHWDGFLPPAETFAWALTMLNQIAALNARGLVPLPFLPLPALALALVALAHVALQRLTPEDRRWRWR